MPKTDKENGASKPLASPGPFRRAVLRGLGVVMPPLLTIVLFIWAWATIDGYVLKPIESGMGRIAVFFAMRSNVLDGVPSDVDPYLVVVMDRNDDRVSSEQVSETVGRLDRLPNQAAIRGWRVKSFQYGGVTYVPVGDKKWIPEHVYEVVDAYPGALTLATAPARDVYEQYVRLQYLPRWRTIPVFLVLFVGVLYLLGKFLAAGVGRIFLTSAEMLINRLPVVRNVYSSVKQVTDIFFTERAIEFNRVVAVEYPRVGIWSVGFVTSESLLDIRSAANEPVLTVLMPTSPMPATGFTINVRKSETIDLDITLDQAIQFIVSCGVVVPPHQQGSNTGPNLSAAIAQRLQSEVGRTAGPDPPPLLDYRKSLPDASRNGDGAPRDAAPTPAPSEQAPPS
ncbi:MAG: DUF502 domain-containing protein [Pirellulaceae bacterium]|jgi:uncharacterized membrane protein|nr:DUF502 domain-containing protein [Pirellulaceae bacterium]